MSLPLIERQDGERVSLHQIRLSRRAVTYRPAPAYGCSLADATCLTFYLPSLFAAPHAGVRVDVIRSGRRGC